MSGPTTAGILLNNMPAYIAAVGALGVAAFGMVEALGKTLFVFDIPGTDRTAGLPYVGFSKVQALIKLVGPALKATYGDDYEDIIKQQYRAGRGKGQAPDTIRQGVRLGVTFLSQTSATVVIKSIWGLPSTSADQLAAALTSPPAPAPAPAAGSPAAPAGPPTVAAPTGPTTDQQQAQALAARFATALDTRVQAAFDLAEEVYETRAQFWAAVIAIGLSLGYQGATTGWAVNGRLGAWAVALLVGLVAVPLAPAAKDLSSSLSDALSALGKLRGGSK